LDYPPVTAYHSYVVGRVARYLNPDYVALHSSRGYESYQHKLFMRYTVLVADLLIFIPAIMLYYFSFDKSPKSSVMKRLSVIALLVNPGLFLIDYGHFQYNNVSLGLFIAAVSMFISGKDYYGSFLFSVALNYKQMELYHALPIFVYLLSKCMREVTIVNKIAKLSKIGLVVILTFGLIYSPFLGSLESISQVVARIFPFNRGLFEDKVASVWCSFSVLIKFKALISNAKMAQICFASTFLLSLPACINLFVKPTTDHLRYALVNVSFVFFLYSFHVHEKSILLVTVPACMLYGSDPAIVSWLVTTSIFSMGPLLIKDGLFIASVCLTVLWVLFSIPLVDYAKSKGHNTPFDGSNITWEMSLINVFSRYYNILWVLSHIGMTILGGCLAFVPPPSRYPDLFPVLIALVSCGHYIVFALYFHYRQFMLTPTKIFSKKVR